MASFNKVILMGNLTRDPDVRLAGTSGMKVARLGLAVSERRRNRSGQMQDFPVFVDVDAWDKLAELCGQYLSKGSSVLVEGRLQMDSWEKDGVKHSKLKVRATTIKFLAARSDRPSASAAPVPAAPAMESDPDDIPF
ncbi:MAG: single-stranded DNA-binding protein [Kiritimatiellia bacterium]